MLVLLENKNDVVQKSSKIQIVVENGHGIAQTRSWQQHLFPTIYFKIWIVKMNESGLVFAQLFANLLENFNWKIIFNTNSSILTIFILIIMVLLNKYKI